MFKILSFLKNKKSVYERNRDLILKNCALQIQYGKQDKITKNLCSIMIVPDNIVKELDIYFDILQSVDEYIICIEFLLEFPSEVVEMTLKRLISVNRRWEFFKENWNFLLSAYFDYIEAVKNQKDSVNEKKNNLKEELLEVHKKIMYFKTYYEYKG